MSSTVASRSHRRQLRPSATHRFGQGIIPHAGRRMPYTQADLDEAVLMFADSTSEPDYDTLAAQRAWEDLYEGGLLTPVEFGRCALCSEVSGDLNESGLCDRCEDRAIDATTACRNYAAGLGREVY